MNVQASDVVALLGPNGAGKTTTLLTISGMPPAIDGETWVLYGGATPGARTACPQALAYVPEDHSPFYQLTVAEQMWLGGVLSAVKPAPRRTSRDLLKSPAWPQGRTSLRW